MYVADASTAEIVRKNPAIIKTNNFFILSPLQENINKSLAILSEKAKGTYNLMPTIIDCIEKDCTLGEISDALRVVFGIHK